jgi:hypothetical protein
MFKLPKMLRLTSVLFAAAAVSACSSSSIPGPIAGAPSSFVPRSYETLASSAEVTSELGGSALRWAAGATTPVTVALSGSYTGTGTTIPNATGRVSINDGTYLFTYRQGVSASGSISSGAAYGTLGDIRIPDTYAYVRAYKIHYPIGTAQGGFTGFAGVVTAQADMPSGGTASYTGVAAVDRFLHNSATPEIIFDRGTSAVNVNFQAGTASVDLNSFSPRKAGSNAPVLAVNIPFDQITGTGLVISGRNFTGGNWVTYTGGVPVQVVGASQTASSNGTFFGYDSTISAPDEVAGVFIIDGSTHIITGRYIAD